jgi:hypothetical protein
MLTRFLQLGHCMMEGMVITWVGFRNKMIAFDYSMSARKTCSCSHSPYGLFAESQAAGIVKKR